VTGGAAYADLRREPGYLRFLVAATVARTADEMFAVAAVLHVLDRTGSPALAGAVVAGITFPSLVSAPLLGAWLDQRGRRKQLMVIDQAVAVTAVVFIAACAGRVPDVAIVAAAVTAGVLWPLSFGGFTSLIPALVRDELLPSANAVEASSMNLAVIVGPLLAGGISAVFSPAAALYTEAGLTLTALVLIARLDRVDQPPAHAGRSLVSVAREGMRLLASVPALRSSTAAGGLQLVGLGFLTLAFPYYCTDLLGVNRGAAGALWAAFAVGSTVGAITLARVQRRFRPEHAVAIFLALFGLLMLTWPLATSLAVALVLVTVSSIPDGPALTATFAARQEHAPRELQGQIFTTAAGVKVGAFALGAALAGPLVVGVGTTGTLLLAAAMQFLGAAVGLLAARGGGA
jgi:predicted MFS family arabinose efflux permease